MRCSASDFLTRIRMQARHRVSGPVRTRARIDSGMQHAPVQDAEM